MYHKSKANGFLSCLGNEYLKSLLDKNFVSSKIHAMSY